MRLARTVIGLLNVVSFARVLTRAHTRCPFFCCVQKYTDASCAAFVCDETSGHDFERDPLPGYRRGFPSSPPASSRAGSCVGSSAFNYRRATPAPQLVTVALVCVTMPAEPKAKKN